ncbi:MAG: DUF2953 domain-containing protein [Clostridiales bacterium]|nr:DUF2953 domain-containing protein [Clostridiales bacterium]
MLLLLAVLLLLEVLLLPLTLQADLRHQGSTKVRVMLKYAFLRHTWPSANQSPGEKRLHRGSKLFTALRESAEARRFFLRHIHLDRLDALLLLRAGDAAATSLLTGSLRGLLCCIPQLHRRHIRIRVQPDFFRPHSTIQLHCIIRLTLGTLLLTILRLLAFRLRQKARTAYGTSHW